MPFCYHRHRQARYRARPQCDASDAVQLVQYCTVGTYRGCRWGTRYLIAVWGTGPRVSIRGIYGIQLI